MYFTELYCTTFEMVGQYKERKKHRNRIFPMKEKFQIGINMLYTLA